MSSGLLNVKQVQKAVLEENFEEDKISIIPFRVMESYVKD